MRSRSTKEVLAPAWVRVRGRVRVRVRGELGAQPVDEGGPRARLALRAVLLVQPAGKVVEERRLAVERLGADQLVERVDAEAPRGALGRAWVRARVRVRVSRSRTRRPGTCLGEGEGWGEGEGEREREPHAAPWDVPPLR